MSLWCYGNENGLEMPPGSGQGCKVWSVAWPVPFDTGHEMVDKILSGIRERVPENITRLLSADELDPAVLFLLQQVQDTMTKDGK